MMVTYASTAILLCCRENAVFRNALIVKQTAGNTDLRWTKKKHPTAACMNNTRKADGAF